MNEEKKVKFYRAKYIKGEYGVEIEKIEEDGIKNYLESLQ
jgi:hypothetical protein